MSSDQAAPWRQQQQTAGGAPPPPPPPPPVSGQVMRLKSEIPQMRNEPPACVQNAMMTKDKKPFTYTPGGLDLSQIKSPRMAKRLTRNANCEGVPQMAPHPPQMAAEPQMVSPPIHQAPPPPPPPPLQPMQLPQIPQQTSPAQPKSPQQRPQVVIPPSQKPAQLGSLYVPPLDSPVTLNKAPTPWLTKHQQAPQQDHPPWVTAREQSQSTPTPPPSVQQTPSPAPSPQIQSPQIQSTQSRSPQPRPPSQPQTPQFRPQQSPQFRPQQQQQQQQQQQPPLAVTRVVPIQIQMTPTQYEPGTPTTPQFRPQFQQQQYQQPQYQQPQYQPPQYQSQPQTQNAQGSVTRIIPIQMETDSDASAQSHPVQSPAFRVLQKMTSNDAPGDQMRRLQLSADDQALMNRLRAQVDDEIFLHNETDPRYRGAAIPSRAFRILQSMTEGNGTLQQAQQSPQQKRNNPNTNHQQHVGPQIPASEQPVAQEPRKYTGGAIPSRSFQMLQAMVSPDVCAQGSETETESSDSFQNEQWYYPPGYPPYYYDPYWGYQYYVPPTPNGEYPQYYYGYDPSYGYYDPYYQYPPEIIVSSEEDTANNTVTDLEPESENEIVSPTGLQAIKSVSDIHTVYNNNENLLSPPASSNNSSTDIPQEKSDEEEDDDDDDDEDDDSEDEVETTADPDEHVPHQLSVIFEESDAIMSDTNDRRREASVVSEDDSSTTIAVDSGDEEETVTVRLPLRFKFSKTDNDQDITTVIVGDSQVDKCNSVSVTVNLPRSRPSSVVSKADDAESDEEDSSDDSSESDEEEESEVVSASANITLSTSKTEEDSGRVSVRDRVLAIENGGKEGSEEDDEEVEEEEEEVEEEEADSGVTSQTDTESECFNDIRKNKYQRAATHSRLFKLLHDECQGDDDDEDGEKEDDLSLSGRQLTLPLVACSRTSVPDSYSSSGIASPASTPPRRKTTCSDQSTPNEVWTDYMSYYSSWDERGGGGCGRRTPVSPFPKQPPRCPMTPVPSDGGGVRGSGGFAAS